MATVARRPTLTDLPPRRTRSLALKPFPEVHHPDASAKVVAVSPVQRPVLFPIPTNARPIRRLPSRMPSVVFERLPSTAGSSRSSSSRNLLKDADAVVSRKRKRGPANGNENFYSSGGMSGTRTAGALKRSRSAYASLRRSNRSVEVVPTTNDGLKAKPVAATRKPHEEDARNAATDEYEEHDDPSDDYYIASAPPWQLHRLLKDELLRLYDIAGLADEEDGGEDLTKNDLVNAIVRARTNSTGSAASPRTRRRISTPPSSSCTDGNDAGAEESDVVTERKRPRKQFLRTISISKLGIGHPTPRLAKSATVNHISGSVTTRGASGARRTRFTSGLNDVRKSPHGGRRRTTSGNTSYRSSPSSPVDTDTSKPNASRQTRLRQSSKTLDAKSKEKRVEFSEDACSTGDESDAVTAEEGEEWDHEKTPKQRPQTNDQNDTPIARRTSTTKRRDAAKQRFFSPKKLRDRPSRPNVGTSLSRSTTYNSLTRTQPLKRSASSRNLMQQAQALGDSEEEDDIEDQVESEEEQDDDEVDQLSEEDVEADPENEEVDELMDDPVPSSTRSGQAQLSLHDESDLTDLTEEESDLTEPAEEDDDEDDDFGAQAEESPAPETPPRTRGRRISRPKPTLSAEEYTSKQGRRSTARTSKRSVELVEPEEDRCASEDEGEGVDEDEELPADDASLQDGSEDDAELEPRVLRNGKVVGGAGDEEEEEEEVDEMESVVEEVVEEDEEDEEQDAVADEDEDLGGEEEEEDDDDMAEEFDLTAATAKSLCRLRRDDLVRLCETRDLEAEGTKIQLAHSLLEWRNQVARTPSSSTQPSSSASTVRAPSTFRPYQNGNPVLLRTNRVHVTQPRTPDPDPDAESIVLIGSKGKEREREGDELELDLESLGLEDREIPVEKLTKLEKIGSGGFKDVFIGKFRGRKVAIAEFRGHLGPMDIKELKLLSDFNHPNVVRFLGVSIPENARDTPVMMVSELCANGDLFDYVRNVPAPPLRKVLNLMLDVARGLDYLHNIHKPSVIHRDCKSSNILITSKVTAKIADFGLAKVKQSTRSMVKSLVGTVNWQAPELWHAHPKYDHKVDVFSCAMVFWEMLQWHSPSKKYPWEGMNEHAIYEEVGAKKHRPSVSGLRKQWCPEIVDLMEAMWRQDPKERPTIAEVVEDLESIIANL